MTIAPYRTSPVVWFILDTLGWYAAWFISCVVYAGILLGWKFALALPVDAAGHDALIARTAERLDRLQDTPATQNGYVELECLVGEDRDPALAEILDEMRWKRGRVPGPEAMSAFETRILPLLRAAADRPAFVRPENWRESDTLGFSEDLDRLQSLLDALLAYGRHLESRGRLSDAADAYGTAVALAARAQSARLHFTYGESMALQNLARLLSGGRLSRNDLERVMRTLEASPSQDLVNAIDALYVQVMEEFDRMGKRQMSVLPWCMRVLSRPIVSRFQLPTQNYYMQVRPALATQDFDAIVAAHRTAAEGLEESPVCLAMLLVEYGPDAFLTTRSQRSAARIVAALQAYRLDRGSYPGSLEMLVPAYLDDVPMDMAARGPFHYRAASGDFTLTSTASVWAQRKLPTTVQLHPYKPLSEQR